MYRLLFWNLDNQYDYLDNAASTPPLKSVMFAINEFLKTYGSIHRGAGKFSEISTAKYEQARDTIMRFINAEPDRDVAIFTANTTDSINRLALLYPWKENDAVLVSDIEHSSNLLPWSKVARVISFRTDENYSITPEAIEEQLKKNKNIRIVAIAGASNITGQIIPAKDIYSVCKKYGVYLSIDASQLAPHYPMSLDDCDILSFSGHKMYAPFGIGVLAGRKEILLRTGLAPTGGGNVCYIHTDGEPVYFDTPWRHEAGTPNGTGAIAIAAAAETLMNIGWDKIIRHNNDVVGWITKHLTQVPNINLYFPIEKLIEKKIAHTPIAVFDIKNIPSMQIAESLMNKNIAVRCGTFCLYRLVERVKKISPEEIETVYNNLKNKCELPDRYHLIRASGGLMTNEDDIVLLKNALRGAI